MTRSVRSTNDKQRLSSEFVQIEAILMLRNTKVSSIISDTCFSFNVSVQSSLKIVTDEAHHNYWAVAVATAPNKPARIQQMLIITANYCTSGELP